MLFLSCLNLSALFSVPCIQLVHRLYWYWFRTLPKTIMTAVHNGNGMVIIIMSGRINELCFYAPTGISAWEWNSPVHACFSNWKLSFLQIVWSWRPVSWAARNNGCTASWLIADHYYDYERDVEKRNKKKKKEEKLYAIIIIYPR